MPFQKRRNHHVTSLASSVRELPSATSYAAGHSSDAILKAPQPSRHESRIVRPRTPPHADSTSFSAHDDGEIDIVLLTSIRTDDNNPRASILALSHPPIAAGRKRRNRARADPRLLLRAPFLITEQEPFEGREAVVTRVALAEGPTMQKRRPPRVGDGEAENCRGEKILGRTRAFYS